MVVVDVNNSLCLANKEEVEKVFKRFRLQRDGQISGVDLSAMLRTLGSNPSDEELARVMAKADTDDVGSISLKEFAVINNEAPLDSNASMVDLRDTFAIYDLDNNSSISTKELHMVLKKLGEKCSYQDYCKMNSTVNLDGDGSVIFEEFKKMMMWPNPNLLEPVSL
ncbi:probable calcium-binding protein CML23 [Amborella trichopoda]|uniref:probable calcium-binding protein CML23 n=1 Tax=Amborella trichopoda TaxID=13333 RepID=UPI0005D45136|nr:probable calcium-binding protein CML23 [Amborella trichopoda]|eukprot:XP_011621439.1 probable calcium-binding protein CML23 [Amborella trichopoda]